ncbi:hypothetical protein TSOC_004644 [Tetrabaena socialis]|uniref:VWFA domain-containing protein n=1 Tax=Tetrabaena socialis TaxID=47790 RepID=A0A2J8A898_9CHLO|nr:hypothetical protein TSOC_004644 [Tetrabaena socialis]|eukprot:PNH08759.1 hypothetical protein TSOC_004644 [Tetrabaena socialis]
MARLVLLLDALHASTCAALREALFRFANVLAVTATSHDGPPDVGLAIVARVGAGVQLQVVYKPSRFVLRDFQRVLTRLREQEAWASPDTRKLALALRSLVQHLARESPPVPVPTRVVVVAHSFTPPAGGLLSKVLEEAAHSLINVSFVRLNSEQSLEVFRSSITACADAPTSSMLPGDQMPGLGQPAALEPSEAAAAPGRAGGGDGADAIALDAAAAAAAAMFSRAVATHENADFCSIIAGPLALEHLTMGWVQQLTQPLAPPEVLLLLPRCPSAAGEHSTTLPPPEQVALRCQLASQLSALVKKCTPCPVCHCHGMPTAPLLPRAPQPSYCCVDGVALLPPEAAPPDPLTVRIGELHELRLSGRGGMPQGVVDEPQQQYGSVLPPLATRPPVRLSVERAVPMQEVDESLLYGWPQVLLPCGPRGLAELSDERRGGGDSGRNGATGADECSAGALAALSQGAALLASAYTSLCDGPIGQLPPVAASFKQWYVLLPGSGCFLVRQMACREQLVPLQPVPPPAEALSPSALAAAESALGLLPGWDGVAVARAAPAPPNVVSIVQAPLEASQAAADALAREGGDASSRAASETPLAGAAPLCGAEAGGGIQPNPDQPPAAKPVTDSAIGPATGDAGGISAPVAATTATAAGEPAPAPLPFSPLLLSCGCHEVLAALLRDSVLSRQPRRLPLQALAARWQTALSPHWRPASSSSSCPFVSSMCQRLRSL